MLGSGSAQIYEDCSILSLFRRLNLFLQVFGQLKEWLISYWHEKIRVSNLAALSIVSLFVLTSRLPGLRAQTYEECLNVSISRRLGSFLLISGQVQE